MRIAVLDDYHHAFGTSPDFARLRDRPEVSEVRILTQPIGNPEGLAQNVGDCEILVAIRERTKFTADALANLPRLRYIAQTGNHLYHVDLDQATRQGVAVAMNTGPSGGSVGTAELSIGLMISVMRRIPQYHRAIQEGRWDVPYGRVLHGKTLGIVGLGKVGRMLAQLAGAFGMTVLAWSPHLTLERAQAAGAKPVPDLEELLAQSDVVSMHLTLSADSRDLLNADRLDKVKRGAVLINTSRGPVVNESALIAALESGHLSGAGLDVFDQEPLAPGHPLRSLPNVVLTPHCGWPTDQAYVTFAEMTSAMINAFLDGDYRYVVNPDALSRQP